MIITLINILCASNAEILNTIIPNNKDLIEEAQRLFDNDDWLKEFDIEEAIKKNVTEKELLDSITKFWNPKFASQLESMQFMGRRLPPDANYSITNMFKIISQVMSIFSSKDLGEAH